jgi:hypothetical protein
MEKFVSKMNSKKYGFNKGDEFVVLRTIMGECVLIVKDEYKPNIIMSENQVRYYGELTGVPVMGGC